MASDIRPPTDKAGKPRAKVALKPGFGLMDWMRLPLSQKSPRPVTLAELKEHDSRFDCWTALHGKVYNITQYLDYHPGGVPMLMKGAGKDCTALFDKYHKWVNIEGLLSKCLVGVLVNDVNNIISEENDEVEKDDTLEDSEQERNQSEAVRNLLENENNEGTESQGDSDTNAAHIRFASALRINPGLQNLAAGGTLHDANNRQEDHTQNTSES